MPLSATAEVSTIANFVDKIIMVIKADYVKTGDINDAILTLNKKENLAGCILNDAHREITFFGQTGTYEGDYAGKYGKYSRPRN
jgi:Mrp family chromosome partitioning ATPase